MKLALTTNGRLYQTPDGRYFTDVVYGYDFFRRYLNVCESIRLIAHVKAIPVEQAAGMLRVDGDGLDIYPVPFPHGKIDYLRKYLAIQRRLSSALIGCDACLLRVPDQLAFQVFPLAKKALLPIGLEITASAWDFFEKGAIKSPLRPALRILWDRQEKRACRQADATCYVTREALQQRYPPTRDHRHFTTNASSVDISEFHGSAREFGLRPLKSLRCLHVAGSLKGRAKGHHELIRALCLIQAAGVETHCKLIGGGALDPELQELVRTHHLDVEVLGKLPASEIFAAMQASDMLIFPSYREGLPRVVIEAMASGLVCVATDLPGIRELLPPEVLAPVRDAKRLSDFILRLCQNPSEMTRLSIQNIAAAQEFAPERIAERRNTFYRYLYQKASDRMP